MLMAQRLCARRPGGRRMPPGWAGERGASAPMPENAPLSTPEQPPLLTHPENSELPDLTKEEHGRYRTAWPTPLAISLVFSAHIQVRIVYVTPGLERNVRAPKERAVEAERRTARPAGRDAAAFVARPMRPAGPADGRHRRNPPCVLARAFRAGPRVPFHLLHGDRAQRSPRPGALQQHPAAPRRDASRSR